MQLQSDSRQTCWTCLLTFDSFRSRLSGVKVRHKRQVLQDMARPLKHWLYKHRDNPYPTKTEKVLLALGSHMTLVQVRRVHAREEEWSKRDFKAVLVLNCVIQCGPKRRRHLCRFPTGLQTPDEGWRTQWGSQTWAGPWGSNCTINISKETLRGWACAVTTLTQTVRTFREFTAG